MPLMTRKQFDESIIAQDDDRDYQESGYICYCKGDVYYIARYSHCSCYGTMEALAGLGISDYIAYDNTEEYQLSEDWSGSLEELKHLVAGNRDPSMPGRVADESDYDYDHLQNLYSQLKEIYKI